MTMPTPSRRDEAIRRLNHQRATGSIGRAFTAIRDQWDEYKHDPEFVTLSCKTLISAASCPPADQPRWNDPAIRALIAGLALQTECLARPSLLAQEIAANSKHERTHKALASLLAPSLSDIIGGPQLNLNAVIVLLAIREHVARRQQRLITRIHKAWLPKCDWLDMTLPYNTMFTASTCTRNIRDLREFTLDSEYLAHHLNPSHWLMLTWVLRRDVLASHAVKDRISTYRAECDTYPSRVIRFLDWCSNTTSPRDDAIPPYDTWTSLRQRLLTHLSAQPDGRNRTDLSTTSNLRDNSRWHRRVLFATAAIRRPFAILRRGAMPRIALCVSGQLRGYQRAWSSWQRNLMPGAHCTVFVHSWKMIGNPAPTPLRAYLPFEGGAFCKAWTRLGTRESPDVMLHRYPTVFRAVSNSRSITLPEVYRHYGAQQAHLDDEAASPFNAMSNQHKMHYKISACYALLGAKAASFDLVVRIRPDLPVRRMGCDWRDIAEWCRNTSTIFADRGFGQQYGHLMIGDQFAVGSPRAMAVYSNAWDLAPRLLEAGLLASDTPFVGHATLAELCWLSGLDVQRAPLQFGPLLEASLLSNTELRVAIRKDATGRLDRIDKELLEALEYR